MKTLIDIDNWNRKEHFLFFSKFEEPFFGVTVKVQCLNEALSFVSSSVLADSLVLRKPLLRQAPKR